MTTMPEDMRHALMHVAGVRLAKNAFMAVYTAAGTVWMEASQKKRIWTPLKGGTRRLMNSTVDRLIEGGYIEKKMDGATVLLEQTDKRAP